jgi:hypothetical protein
LSINSKDGNRGMRRFDNKSITVQYISALRSKLRVWECRPNQETNGNGNGNGTGNGNGR